MEKRKRAPGGGRKPRGEYSRKSAVFSTRITQDLRDALDAESSETGQSLSQIVEKRLRESIENTRSKRELGPKHVRALAFIVARLATILERECSSKWTDDRFTFEALKVAISTALEQFAPKGEAVVPQSVKSMNEKIERDTGHTIYGSDIDPAFFGASFGRAIYALTNAAYDPFAINPRADDLLHLTAFLRDTLISKDDADAQAQSSGKGSEK